MEKITVAYETSVHTPAGWRGVTVTVEAEKISPKRAKVVRVIDVDGNGATGNASRTGARRQSYWVGGVAAKEEGKTKNLSACQIV